MKKFLLLFVLLAFGAMPTFAQKNIGTGNVTKQKHPLYQYFGKTLYLSSVTKSGTTTTYSDNKNSWLIKQDGTITVTKDGVAEEGKWIYDGDKKTISISLDRNTTPWDIITSTATKLELVRGSDKMVFTTLTSGGSTITR